MVPGIPNPYVVMPLNKLVIAILDEKTLQPNLFETYTVLYNPQSYRMTRQALPAPNDEKGSGRGRRGRQQFPKSSTVVEMLEFDLFLDSFSAANETVAWTEKLRGLKFAGNSVLPSITKLLTVDTYAKQIADLTKPKKGAHHPPLLGVKWGTLQFPCFMQSCTTEYVKFNELGRPMRAVMHVAFVSAETLTGKSFVRNSPDTSKFHTVKQGETLNTVSEIAFDDPADWRLIADANDIGNPRVLRTGSVLHMPAKV